ncbi:MAG TPA: hypothetical protein VNN19_06335, partial [bacterium]|nr:hypothetical protein [bacterium]
MGPRVWILIALLLGASSLGAAPSAPTDALSGVVETVRRQGCTEARAADLRRLAEEPPPTGPRAAYVLGHCLRQLGQASEAREAFDLAAREHPTLSGHARLYAAAIALAGQDLAAVIHLLSALPSTTSPDVRRRAALLRAEALLRVGRAAEAAAVLRSAPLGGAEEEVQAEIWWWRGQAALAAGDRAGARRAYAMAWWAYPGSAREGDALAALRALTAAPEAAIPPEARIARGRRLLARGERR